MVGFPLFLHNLGGFLEPLESLESLKLLESLEIGPFQKYSFSNRLFPNLMGLEDSLFSPSFSFLFHSLFRFGGVPSLFFAFLVFLIFGPLSKAQKNFHSDAICTDPVRNFPILSKFSGPLRAAQGRVLRQAHAKHSQGCCSLMLLHLPVQGDGAVSQHGMGAKVNHLCAFERSETPRCP